MHEPVNMENQSVTITLADNGVIVSYCCSGEDGHEDTKKVYKSLKEAFKEIPAMFSVMRDEEGDQTNSDKELSKKKDKMMEY